MHGIFKWNAEFKALPHFRIIFIEVIIVQDDRLAIDVFNGGHQEGDCRRSGAHGNGQRHRRQHMSRVIFLVQRFVAGNGPASSLDHIHVKAMLFIKAHRLRHDDRCRAGDGNKADIEFCLFRLAKVIQNGGLCLLHWKDGGNSRSKCGAAQHFGE